jgi:hypothetical protein
MFCPKCKAEYRDGFNTCSDCGVQLVGRLPDEPSENVCEHHTLVRLYAPDNEIELALLKGILEDAGINYYVRNDIFGSMEVGPQIELYNKKMIMVSDSQLKRAVELIKDFKAQPDETRRAPQEKYSFFDKIRMALEIALFGWLMPGRKKRKHIL